MSDNGQPSPSTPAEDRESSTTETPQPLAGGSIATLSWVRPSKPLLIALLGVLLCFVQANVTSNHNDGLNALASLWRIDRTNIDDVWPSIEAAARISRGQSAYTQVSAGGASFIYPPLAALPYRPLVGLSRAAVGVYLFVVNRLLLLVVLALLFALARPKQADRRSSLQTLLGVTAAVLLWYPLLRAVQLNQATVLITALIGAGLLAMEKDRSALAGIALALAVAIKPPLALAAPLLIWHSPRAFAGAVVFALVLTCASVGYAGWGDHVYYLARVLPSLSTGYVFYPNQSWNGLVGRLLYPELALHFTIAPRDSLALAATWALGGLTYLYFALRIHRLRSRPGTPSLRTDVFGLAWLAATLTAPLAWEHHYAPAIFCLALFYRRLPARAQASASPFTWAVAVSAALMASYVEVRGLSNPLSLLFASHVFAGAALFSLLWFKALEGEASMASMSRRLSRLRRFLVPIPDAVQVRLEAAVLGGCVLLSLYLIGQLLLFQYGRDQGIYAVVARTMVEGGLPYRDAWDFKPPGIFFVYAGARLIFGSGIVGVRILEALGLLSLFPAFVIISRRSVGSWRPAIPAVVLSVMAYVQLEFWNTAQPESFAGFLLVWAMVLASSRVATAADVLGASQKLIWIAIGLAFGAAGIYKPQLAGGVVLVPLLLGYARAESFRPSPFSWRRRLEPLLFASIGAAAPIAAVVVCFMHYGALGWMTDTLFGFVPHYSHLGHEGRGLFSLVVQGCMESLFRFSRHDAFGLLLLVALPAIHAAERRATLTLVAIIFFPLLGVGLQAKFFPYHYGAIVPLIGLPAGWGLWKLWLRLRMYLLPVVALVLVALLLKDERVLPPYRASLWDRNWVRAMAVLGEPKERDELMDLLHQAGDVNAVDNRHVAEWIASNTPADQSIFIWGFEPVIYELARRPLASRYIYNVPQRVSWSGAHRRRLLDDLAARPPAVVVLETRDVFPDVTGNVLDSVGALAQFPELAKFLARSYLPGPRFGKLALLVRRQTLGAY